MKKKNLLLKVKRSRFPKEFPYDDEDALFPDDFIDDELDNDGINSWEAGFWKGNNHA